MTTSPNKMSEYPPYACSCCGVTNGDMLYDYIKHNAETLTYAEVVKICDEFDSYRIQWNAHAKETAENIKSGKPRRKRVTK